MARLLLSAVIASSLLVALPVAAQERRPESARDAGLRYLSWPGRPPVNSTPARVERTAPPRPRVTPQPQPQSLPETTTPERAPEVRASIEPTARSAASTTGGGDGARYYSVHRRSGRTPDPIDQARVLAAEDTLVALQSPQGQTLAEQDRTARADEAFEILRSLPPDQLMDMLDRQP